MKATRRPFPSLLPVIWLVAAIGALLVGWQMQPPEVHIDPADGAEQVDPRLPVTIVSTGFGSRLSQVEVRNQQGQVLARFSAVERVVLPTPLDFGTRYTVSATAERPWLQQSTSRVFQFATVAMPQLLGPKTRRLAADKSVLLAFDEPVGELTARGEVQIAVEPEADRRRFRLKLSGYRQGKIYPVEVQRTTITGVPLPPLTLSLQTPPPLTARLNARGLSNIGLALPLLVTFSEPLTNRQLAQERIQISVREQPASVEGRWQWLGKRRLQFTPTAGWPANSTIDVRVDPEGLSATGGGTLEQPAVFDFRTGSDRRIFVYLDRQRVEAVENGQLVRSFTVSTGKGGTPTVTGTYYIYARYPIKTMRSRARPGESGYYVVENVPFAQYFHEGYAFHGAWWHNAFGRPMSHGCVNMSTRKHNARWPNAGEDAGWLYNWAALGVPVTVFAKTPA